MLDLNHLAALVAAPFAGSFAAVLIARFPGWRGAGWGRSHCPSCAHRLAWRDLMPVFSYVVARGRCRYCGARIDWLYPAVELAALAIAAWAVSAFDGVLLWATCLLGWALLVLAAIDLRHFLLPNAITLPLIAAGIAVDYYAERDAVWHHLAGAASGFAVLALLAAAYRRLRQRQGLGMGDAKLFAAAGAWVGWYGLPSVLLIAAPAALVVTLTANLVTGRRSSLGEAVPFGPYLAVGLWLTWLYGPLQFAAGF